MKNYILQKYEELINSLFTDSPEEEKLSRNIFLNSRKNFKQKCN